MIGLFVFRVVANFLILISDRYSYYPSISKFLHENFTYELRYSVQSSKWSIENTYKNLKIMNMIDVTNAYENILTCYADLFYLTVCRVPLSRGKIFLRKVIRGISFQAYLESNRMTKTIGIHLIFWIFLLSFKNCLPSVNQKTVTCVMFPDK